MYTTNAATTDEVITQTSPAKELYRIEEIPDLMCDACVVDKYNQLVFLSVWGRDTSLQELYSRITLGRKDKELGLDCLTIKVKGFRTTVRVDDVKRLTKRSTRSFKQTKFGSLMNTWIFDTACIKPDKPNRTAKVLIEGEVSMDHFCKYIWSVVKDVCPLPLLDHWQSEISILLGEYKMYEDLKTLFGQVGGISIHLDVPLLETKIGELIVKNTLTTYPKYPTGTLH